MDAYHVRYVEGDEQVQISFDYSLPSGKIRRFNFNRSPDEVLSNTIQRMSCGIKSKVEKKRKKKKNEEDQETEPETQISISLFDGDQTIDESLTNKQAWLKSSILEVNNVKYNIQFNPPKVKSIKLPDCIMAEYPIVPLMDVEFSDLNQCKYKWLVEQKEGDNNTLANPAKKRRTSSGSTDAYQLASESYIFTPSPDDVDKKLKFECIPSDGSRDGDVVSVETKSVVMLGPEHCPFEERHFLTQQPCGSQRYYI